MPGHVILTVEATAANKSEPSPIAAQLRSAGHEVLISSKVSEAVGLVFVNPCIDAVLISSYVEPMTGAEAAGRLLAINPRIPIIVVGPDLDGQSSTPDSERLIFLALVKLEQLWQGHHQEENQGSQCGESNVLQESVTSPCIR